MKNDYYSNFNDYINRWVISYADFVTMLLALFMVMFATSHMGATKVKDVNKSIQKVFTNQTVIQETKNLQNEENVKNVETQTKEQNILEESGKTILDGKDGILDSAQVMEQIKQDLDVNTSIKVLKSDRGVVIRLNDTMLFDPGSAIIKSEAMNT